MVLQTRKSRHGLKGEGGDRLADTGGLPQVLRIQAQMARSTIEELGGGH